MCGIIINYIRVWLVVILLGSKNNISTYTCIMHPSKLLARSVCSILAAPVTLFSVLDSDVVTVRRSPNLNECFPSHAKVHALRPV